MFITYLSQHVFERNYLNTFFSPSETGPLIMGRKRVRDGAELWNDPKI